MAPTRVTVVEETLAEPKDFELYKQTYENIVLVGAGTYGSVYFVRERDTGEVAAAKYLRQEKSKVRREAQILRSLIQSAFVVRLAGLYESSLNSVLVTEYLAGGDLVTRTAPEDYNLTERKCQIFIRQVGLSLSSAFTPLNISSSPDSARCPLHPQQGHPPPGPEALQHHVRQSPGRLQPAHHRLRAGGAAGGGRGRRVHDDVRHAGVHEPGGDGLQARQQSQR